MRLEWDEAKNRANVREHGFDFAEGMFRGALLVRPDTGKDYGEERWIGIGNDSGPGCRCSIRRTSTGYNPDHLAEEGAS